MLPIVDFAKNRAASSGLHSRCRKCNSDPEGQRQRHIQRRAATLSHYSVDKNHPACVCCGEDIDAFLCIDHIDGGGCQHKRDEGFSNLTGYLFRMGFPPGFQVLCHNCNAAKGRNGQCPHRSFTPGQGTDPAWHDTPST